MNDTHKQKSSSHCMNFVRLMADQAFSRSAGAPLVTGNNIRLLFDSTENFPEWEKAISNARTSIFIEIYIFANNSFGQHIRNLLIEKAKRGIAVYIIYDWFGCWHEHYFGFFSPIIQAGGHVRAYNPFSLIGFPGIFGRDHRKLIIVDNEIAFVSGLCLSGTWQGKPEKDIPPWRDTGMEMTGPIVQDAIDSFLDSWKYCGGNLDETLNHATASQTPTGDVAARLIATTPSTANMMRTDLLLTSFARETLWITDAYFMGTSAYLNALKSAAKDGVDVRILVPRSSDVRWIATVSRTLYRPLLESGVRVFEWDGPMIHAKSAVADGRWTRIGSTNLNLSSWLANRELDVFIEDKTLSGNFSEKFLQDLEKATEVVLSGPKKKLALSKERPKKKLPRFSGESVRSGTSAAVRQAMRITDAVSAVTKGTRAVEGSEANAFLTIGLAFLIFSALLAYFPYIIVIPVTLLLFFAGIAIIAKSIALYWRRKHQYPGPDATVKDSNSQHAENNSHSR